MSKRLTGILLVALSVVFLAACGGGSSSGVRQTPPATCPAGQTGTPPNCVTPPPATCPAGQTGTPPNCVTPPPATCPAGQTGTPPNCVMTGGEEMLTPIERAVATAAASLPRPGSVTQSSDSGSAVSATVRYVGGQPEYSIVNGSVWTVDSASDSVVAREAGYIELRKDLARGTLWVDVGTDFEEPTTMVTGGCGSGATVAPGESCTYTTTGGQSFSFTVAQDGRACLESICAGTGINLSGSNINFGGVQLGGFQATRNSSGEWEIHALPAGATPTGGGTTTIQDNHYLALGTWEFYPSDGTGAAEVGAFADGNDPFEQRHLNALTGRATYRGVAGGIAVDGSGDLDYFGASVTLTADFGDGSSLGSIGGRVHDFADDDGVPVAGNPQLMLESADIGHQNSGFFSGDTSGILDGSQYSGNWGGQFFGNGVSSNERPESVAGTFGAATADGTGAILGAFGADKQ